MFVRRLALISLGEISLVGGQNKNEKEAEDSAVSTARRAGSSGSSLSD